MSDSEKELNYDNLNYIMIQPQNRRQVVLS